MGAHKKVSPIRMKRREFKLVDLRRVGADTWCQREFDEKRAQEMARFFDLWKFRAPVISERSDGSMVYLDGQHSGNAYVMAGHTDPVMCEVVYGLTPEEEAGLFDDLNTLRKAVSAIDRFRVRVNRGCLVENEVQRILDKHGLQVAAGKSTIGAPDTLIRVHTKLGTLDRTLVVCSRWAEVDHRAFKAAALKAVGMFLRKYPEADQDRLSERLMEWQPTTVIGRIRSLRKSGHPESEAIMTTLRPIYNKGLRKKLPVKR